MMRRFLLKREHSKTVEGIQFSNGIVVLETMMGEHRPLDPICHATIEKMLHAAHAYGGDGWVVEWIDEEVEV